jgi:hypothetical protein
MRLSFCFPWLVLEPKEETNRGTQAMPGMSKRKLSSTLTTEQKNECRTRPESTSEFSAFQNVAATMREWLSILL